MDAPIGTPFEEIIDRFLFKTKLYNLQMVHIDDRNEIVEFYFKGACSKFYKKCRKNLLDRNEEAQAFIETLDEDEIDILAELMIAEWLKPMMYDDELLESRLNTKDFTEYSPAKLIEQIRMVYSMNRKESKALINNYTFTHGDVGEVNIG